MLKVYHTAFHFSTHASENVAVDESLRTFLWYSLVWLTTTRPDELGVASMFSNIARALPSDDSKPRAALLSNERACDLILQSSAGLYLVRIN